MKRSLLKKIAFLGAYAVCALPAVAVPAKPGIVKVSQPDGTFIMAEIKGDEDFSWYEDASGKLMVGDKADGFLKEVSAAGLEQLRAASLSDKAAAVESARKKSAARITPAEIKRDFPTTGTVRGLIVLAEFQDVKFQPESTRDYFDAKVNQPDYSGPETYGSVNDFFREQSRGVFTPEFDIVGPVTLPRDRASYGLYEDLDGLFRDAAVQAQAEYGTDFSRYDINGDKFVDFFFVIFAGHGEAQGGGIECVWPAMKDITDYVFDSFGGMYLGVAACSCELKGGEGNDPDGVGTICHEFSHILGLPDIYDPMGTGYGMGHYDIMCYGPYNDDGRTPCNYTSMEKFTLGWIEPTVLDKPTEGYTLHDFGETDECVFIVNPANANEYYTLENRQQTGFDKALPGHGLVISYCHYDKSAWAKNTVNSPLYSRYEHVSIIPADNFRDTQKGEDGDPWPGTTFNMSFTDTSLPAARWFSTGDPVGQPVTNIQEDPEGVITFDFMFTNGVDSIEATAEEAEYYDLQGYRVNRAMLSPGIYICRKGGETSRVVIR